MNKSFRNKRKRTGLCLLTFGMVLSVVVGCRSRKQLLQQKEQESFQKLYIPKKHEMRAAWIQTVFQPEYAQMSPAQMRADFIQKLDKLKKLGFNAIFFQVRPESDAWYKSRLEPWSRFLTGQQGLAPYPEWDPMAFLIEECHKRMMEFHAWINPYRAATGAVENLAVTHPYRQHPEWFFRYGTQLFYNPALQACRDHICTVVEDILQRYDVDGIHMDDYFYPYPKAGLNLPDRSDFERNPRGFHNISDWRRDNVNQLIRQLKETIVAQKPWVRFGVSPFGIYRNARNDKGGSRTNGLQNYDDLYADVLLWDREGWVDYIVPQIYWELGHKAANYTELVYWWGKNIKRAHYYVGEDVARTMRKGELHPKMIMANEVAQGVVMWPANEILRDNGGVQEKLKHIYFATPALPPTYENMGAIAPEPVEALRSAWTAQGYSLIWWNNNDPLSIQTPYYYVVYCFGKGEKVDLQNPDHIVSIQKEAYYVLPYVDGSIPLTYVVTAVSRLGAESTGIMLRVRV